jgi:hypothetical protein
MFPDWSGPGEVKYKDVESRKTSEETLTFTGELKVPAYCSPSKVYRMRQIDNVL